MRPTVCPCALASSQARFRPRLETLENRWAPGSILLGEGLGASWLAWTLADDAASWSDGQASHLRLAEPAAVSCKTAIEPNAPGAPRGTDDSVQLAASTSADAVIGSDVVDELARSLDLAAPEDGPAPGGPPLPIPGGFANPTGGPFVHINLPGPVDQPPPNPPTSPQPNTNDPSLITDFNGEIGVASVSGTGTDNHGNTLYFNVDLRFMQGVYRDVNGQQQHGTFALV
jgi:hypothetical protein